MNHHQQQQQQQQQAIDFNNSGVTFFEQGRYEDALVLFLGSMEVMSSSSSSSSSSTSSSSVVDDHGEDQPSFEKQASRTLKKQLRPLINKMEVSTTTTRTEDKTTTNEYVYSKTIRLPYNNTTTTVVNNNNTNNDLQKLQSIVVNNKVNSAIILYNTALCHHLWNYDDGSGNESSSSKTRAIKLYEMACHVIATIDTAVITCRLLLAIVTNMIHLYNELGMTGMSNTYRIHLYDIVNLQYYWNQTTTTTTTLTINNMMNTSDNGEEVRAETTTTTTTREIDELISNATFLLNYSPQYHGASAA